MNIAKSNPTSPASPANRQATTSPASLATNRQANPDTSHTINNLATTRPTLAYLTEAGSVGLGHLKRCIALSCYHKGVIFVNLIGDSMQTKKMIDELAKAHDIIIVDSLEIDFVALGFKDIKSVIIDSYLEPLWLYRRYARDFNLIALDDMQRLDYPCRVLSYLMEEGLSGYFGLGYAPIAPMFKTRLLLRHYERGQIYPSQDRRINVFITLGKSALAFDIAKLVDALADDKRLDFIIVGSYEAPSHLAPRVRVYDGINASNMLWLLKASDLAIAQASLSALEAASSGVKVLAILRAKNQMRMRTALAKNMLFIDESRLDSVAGIKDAFKKLNSATLIATRLGDALAEINLEEQR